MLSCAESSLLGSLLPGGSDANAKVDLLERTEPSPMMQHSIIALLSANAKDRQESVRDASVIGFLYVIEVDEKKGKMRVLAPLSGRLPRPVMLWGQWPESVGDLVG